MRGRQHRRTRRHPSSPALHARHHCGGAPGLRYPATSATATAGKPTLVRDPVPPGRQTPRRGHRTCHHFLNRVQPRPAEPTPGPPISFTSLNTHPETGMTGAFSHGHRSDHHPSPGGPPSHTSHFRPAVTPIVPAARPDPSGSGVRTGPTRCSRWVPARLGGQAERHPIVHPTAVIADPSGRESGVDQLSDGSG